MNKLSDFPTQQELDDMDENELEELWKRLLNECSPREEVIACRAFDIGWRFNEEVAG